MRTLRTVLTVIGAVTVLVLAGNTVSLAATGHGLILGKTNKANKVTTLKRTTAGSPLSLVATASGTAPFTTNGKGKVTNLNADKVDGIDSSALQTRSYVFRSAFAAKTQVNFDLALPNGSYLVSYSNFFVGVTAPDAVQCYVEEHVPPSAPRDTAYSSFNFTSGNSAPGLTGSGLATKTAGGTVSVHCDTHTGTFSTDPATPMEIVATPTRIVSLSSPVPARVAPVARAAQ